MRHLAGIDSAALTRYVAETRRSELMHWLSVGCLVAMLVPAPTSEGLGLLGIALIVNVPCILTMRSNRMRIVRVLAWRDRQRQVASR